MALNTNPGTLSPVSYGSWTVTQHNPVSTIGSTIFSLDISYNITLTGTNVPTIVGHRIIVTKANGATPITVFNQTYDMLDHAATSYARTINSSNFNSSGTYSVTVSLIDTGGYSYGGSQKPIIITLIQNIISQPIATTNAVTSITNLSSILNGSWSINYDPTLTIPPSPVNLVGFIWSETTAGLLSIQTTISSTLPLPNTGTGTGYHYETISNDNKSGSFNKSISSLTSNTIYYYKFFSRTSNTSGGLPAIVFGSQKSFTTNGTTIDTFPGPGTNVNWYQVYSNWVGTSSNIPDPFTSGFNVKSNTSQTLKSPLYYYFNGTFSSDKNYQILTTVDKYSINNYPSDFLEIKSPWGDSFVMPKPKVGINSLINLIFYSDLKTSYSENNDFINLDYFYTSVKNDTSEAKNPIIYLANNKFNIVDNGGVLLESKVIDLGWNIQGFAFFNHYTASVGNQYIRTDLDPSGKGWHFINNKFIWFNRYSGVNDDNINNYPVGKDLINGEKTSNSKYLINNYISIYIPHQSFNITFDYQNDNQLMGIKIYVGDELPSYSDGNLVNSGRLIGTLKQSNGEEIKYVGLEGNQFLYIISDSYEIFPDVSLSATYSLFTLENISISGGYNESNNKLFSTEDFKLKTAISGATYSITLGNGDTVNDIETFSTIDIKSKMGNGSFKSGIWENGVWNSGWREDTNMFEFYEIVKFFSYNRDKVWRVEISGPEYSVENFVIGSKVSISNIVAIDINEDRKILKNYYTIISKTDTTITVEFENDFPLRRIEIDSSDHRILITKNIWLNGVFLNGYFKGIWNNGLFSGYPLITKMDDSHWIDGIFNGGHFTSSKYGTTFSGATNSNFENTNRLGLIFTNNHKLKKGDIISIDRPGVDNTIGTTVVLELVNDKQIITGVSWRSEYNNISGNIYTTISSGLIQNFDFYSNNVSNKTSLQVDKSEKIFSYNSWIDVSYSTQTAVNIGSPQYLIEESSLLSYSPNNLYGYPTNDILSSNSTFRDSFSLTIRKYKLGNKFKLYDDYVGDSSKFEEYFDSTDTINGSASFNAQGWDFKVKGSGSLTFSRTTDGKELEVNVSGDGGVLNLIDNNDILNRSNSKIEKLRYTMVEFDLLSGNFGTDNFISPIHFNNINETDYLPISKNINHLTTRGKKKQEFFYNKTNLLMNFKGGDTVKTDKYLIDNLKFYQVNMVPFFQYFTYNNINRSVKIPNNGKSPDIIYVSDNLNDDTLNNNDILSIFIDSLIIKDVTPLLDLNWTSDYILLKSSDGLDYERKLDITLNEPGFVNSLYNGPIIKKEEVIVNTTLPPELTLGTITSFGVGPITLTYLGESQVTQSGLIWDISTIPELSSSEIESYTRKSTDGLNTLTTFNSQMTGLTNGTLYYVRAYAKNLGGIALSVERNFTYSSLPILITTPISNVVYNPQTVFGVSVGASYTTLESYSISSGGSTVDGPTLNMYVDDLISENGIIISRNNNLSISNHHGKFITSISTNTTTTTTRSFTRTVELSPNTTYYIRSYATTNIGTGYGNIIVYKTPDPNTLQVSNNSNTQGG